MKVILAAIIFVACIQAMGRAESTSTDPSDSKVDMTFGRISPLKAVVEIAKQKRIPLGIVVGSRSTLCAEKPSIRINSATLREAFSQATEGTGYMVTRDDDVYVLMPRDVSQREMSILAFQFDRFSATDSTI